MRAGLQAATIPLQHAGRRTEEAVRVVMRSADKALQVFLRY